MAGRKKLEKVELKRVFGERHSILKTIEFNANELQRKFGEIDSSLETVIATKIDIENYSKKLNMKSYNTMEDFVNGDGETINSLNTQFGITLNRALTAISCSIEAFAELEANITTTVSEGMCSVDGCY